MLRKVSVICMVLLIGSASFVVADTNDRAIKKKSKQPVLSIDKADSSGIKRTGSD